MAAAPRRPLLAPAETQTEPETLSPSKKPASEDPFKIHTREDRRVYYEKMKEEKSSGTAGAARGTWERTVRAGALTELTR